jgi:hypothetical protein
VKSGPDFLNQAGAIEKLQTTIIYNYKKTKENHMHAQIVVNTHTNNLQGNHQAENYNPKKTKNKKEARERKRKLREKKKIVCDLKKKKKKKL